MSLADEVQSVRQRVAARLAELEPLAREYEQLTRLAGELGLPAAVSQGTNDHQPAAPRRAKPPGRATLPASRRTKVAARRRAQSTPSSSARHAGAGALRERVLQAVRSSPGVSVAEIAALLGIEATKLYRPVRELTSEGALIKRARALFPPEAQA
jgi:hypothetical protein